MAHPAVRGVVLAAVVPLLLSIGVLLGPSAAPAAACSCMSSTDEEAFARADAVFVGELLDYEPPPAAEVMSSGDPATWTFGVSEVYKGEVTAVQEIVSAVSGATCGLEIPRQGEFIVFASAAVGVERTGDGQYQSGLCDGTRPTDEGPLGMDVEGIPPLAMPNAGPTDTSATVEAGAGRDWLPWAAVAAAALACTAGFAVWRARTTANRGQPSGP